MNRGSHCCMGPPGVASNTSNSILAWRCSCGAAFNTYYRLAGHVRRSINCPRCGTAPADLDGGDLHRWQCGHWIANDDPSAEIRGDAK